MAFPTTSVLDNFNRADGALGAAWTSAIPQTADPGAVITGNQASFGTFGRSSWWNAGTVGPDCEVFGTVATKPANGSGWLQLWARIQGPGAATVDSYKIELGPAAGTDSVDVYRVIDNADTLVGSVAQEFTAGDRLGAEVLGTGATVTINLYRHNGVSWLLLGAVLDTNAARIVSAGYIGMGAFQSTDTLRLDDFGGGTVVAGSTPAPRMLGTLGVGT